MPWRARRLRAALHHDRRADRHELVDVGVAAIAWSIPAVTSPLIPSEPSSVQTMNSSQTSGTWSSQNMSSLLRKPITRSHRHHSPCRRAPADTPGDTEAAADADDLPRVPRCGSGRPWARRERTGSCRPGSARASPVSSSRRLHDEGDRASAGSKFGQRERMRSPLLVAP